MLHFVADGIGPEGLLMLGGIFFVLPAAAVVLVEAVIIRVVGRLPFRRALTWSVRANVVSALAGIPFFCLFAGFNRRFVPSDLDRYFTAYLWFACFRYLVYFAESVIVEFLYARRLNARQTDRIPAGRLFAAILAANVASYSLVTPVHYGMTRPTHTFARLLPGTAWANDLVTPILFLDPATHYLRRTNVRGTMVETLVPWPMTAYQVSPDLDTCVSLNGPDLWYYRRSRAAPPVHVARLVHLADERDPMCFVALSPSGTRVAYTVPVEQRNEAGYPYTAGYTLCVFNVEDRQTTSSPRLFSEDRGRLLAWTTDERTIASPNGVGNCLLISLDGAGGAPTTAPSAIPPLCPNYGNFGTILPDLPWPEIIAEDAAPRFGLYATAYQVLQPQRLVLSRNAAWPRCGPNVFLSLNDNPGIPLVTGHRRYADVAFVPDSDLVLLADETYSMLYVIDPATRTIGKLTAGIHPVLLTPRYQVARWFERGRS